MSTSIKRRQFLNTVGAGAASLALGRDLAAQRRGGKPLNILWISTEDISPDLGCYGVDVDTPNLDRFAAQGVRYTNAYGHHGVCAPVRSGIITGMYPTTIGSNNMRTSGKGYECVPPPEVKCFTEYLRAAGYYCTNRSKTDYQFHAPLTAWDHNIPFNQGGADWRGREKDQPFFCVINFTSTHESRIRIPVGKTAKFDPARVDLPPYYPDTPVARNDYACYLENIEAMDGMAQEVLDWLEEDGLAENTVVWFWGDHGRGLPRAKRWIYDSGLQIPLMIRWPGEIDPGLVDDQLVSFIDFAPTMLSIAGVPIPAHMQGQAFIGEQQASKPRDYIYAGRDRVDEVYDLIRAVRDKRYKYIRNYHPEKPYAQYIEYMDLMPMLREMRQLHAAGKLNDVQELWFSATKPVEELYDCREDPHEVNNLADSPDHQDILKRLRDAHERWTVESKDVGHIPEMELIERMWPGGVQPRTIRPAILPYGGAFNTAVQVSISCRTLGASLAWTTDTGPDPHWKLYSKPITVKQTSRLRVRAGRIGFKDSPEVHAQFDIG